MERPEFTQVQEDWLCHAIDVWYCMWKNNLTAGGVAHCLGYAKEELKFFISSDKEKGSE